MISDTPIQPTPDALAVIVAHEVTADGRIVTVTTVHMHGREPETRRDVHSAAWSVRLARLVLTRAPFVDVQEDERDGGDHG